MINKRLAFETALDMGKVRVVFDMTLDTVILPDIARKFSFDGKHLALDYSKLFNMPKFKVTDEGITAVLSFEGKGYDTFIPWAAVEMLVRDGLVLEAWPASVPEEPPDKWFSDVIAEG